MFGFGKRKNEAPPPCATVAFVTASEAGLVRKENQDNLFVDAAARFFCVADGMGGGAEGARASAMVCARLKAALASLGGVAAGRACVDAALGAASAEIFRYAAEHGFKQMGSTACVLTFGAGFTTGRICHVGDSRVYRVRRGLCKQLTRDHSVGVELGALIDRHRMDEFKDRANPLSHILTRAVGTQETVRTDWTEIDVETGDRYVVCSDGVHDVVSATRLAALVGAGPIATARDRLAAEVVKCGAPDNYTFILVEVKG